MLGKSGKRTAQQAISLLSAAAALCCRWRTKKKIRRGEAEQSEEGKERKPKSEQFNCVLVPKELRCAEEPRCLEYFLVNSHWWRKKLSGEKKKWTTS
jgi:hypothetical protein